MTVKYSVLSLIYVVYANAFLGYISQTISMPTIFKCIVLKIYITLCIYLMVDDLHCMLLPSLLFLFAYEDINHCKRINCSERESGKKWTYGVKCKRSFCLMLNSFLNLSTYFNAFEISNFLPLKYYLKLS